jgi:hypothetical protein
VHWRTGEMKGKKKQITCKRTILPKKIFVFLFVCFFPFSFSWAGLWFVLSYVWIEDQ